MGVNSGKQFEQAWKSSVPDYAALIRLNDSPQAFKQSNLTRFTPRTPFDYICFDTKSQILHCWELKTTKSKSISFEDINSDEIQNKMVHKHQILGLKELSKYKNVRAGFLFNFRHFEDDKEKYFEKTYYQSIDDFLIMIGKINKKSFDEADLILHGNAIKINGEKKRVRFRWDIDEFLGNMSRNMNE